MDQINQDEQTQGQAPAMDDKNRRSRLLSNILMAVSIVLFLSGAYLIVRQYVYIPDSYVAPATPIPALPTPSALPTPTQTAEVTPSPTPYIKKIPVTLHFTDREISCPIEPVGIVDDVDKKGRPILDENGEPIKIMGTINSAKVAAWLEDGPSPGELGNAIINGHIRWAKVAGVFSVLGDMTPGEEIAVTYDDGGVMYFAVDSVDIFTIDDWPEWVMEIESLDTRVTLITCHGEWNSAQGTSNERVVVVARPIEEQGNEPLVSGAPS